MIRPLSQRVGERHPRLVLIVPTPDARAPIRTALSLTAGGGRLRTISLTRAGDGLPPELRIALFGLSARSEADRAIQHLVDSATRGAHVAPEPIPEHEQDLLQFAHALGQLPEDIPLLVSWTRGGALPDPERLRPLLDAWRGPIVLHVDAGPDLSTEVLGLMPDGEALGPVVALLESFERTLPVFRVPESNARAAVGDCSPRTLVVAALPPRSDLESAVPGRLLLVIPATAERLARAEQVLALIDRVRTERRTPAASPAGSSPPPPAQ